MSYSEGDQWLETLKALTRDSVFRFQALQREMRDIQIEFDPLTPGEIGVPFVFVDGGSTLFDLMGGSMYFVRAAGACFCSPAAPIWNVCTDAGLTTLPRDADRYTSIARDTLEINCALGLLDHYPGFVVLDNSLASYATTGVPFSVIDYFTPKGTLDNTPESEYFQAFVAFMKTFDSLIRECTKRDIILIGAAKDPRSRSLAIELGVSVGLTDRTIVALAANGRTGFTKPMATSYLKVPRVTDYFDRNGILTEGRADFQTLYGILAPRAPVFRIDLLSAQMSKLTEIEQFVTSLHDGRGYMLPSHVVHDRARMPGELSEPLFRMVKAEVAKEDMAAAETMFGDLRRARFG